MVEIAYSVFDLALETAKEHATIANRPVKIRCTEDGYFVELPMQAPGQTLLKDYRDTFYDQIVSGRDDITDALKQIEEENQEYNRNIYTSEQAGWFYEEENDEQDY